MPKQRIRRIYKFLEEMEIAPSCSNRIQAFDLFYTSWLKVNADSSVPDKDIEKFRKMQLRSEDGWLDLEADPCYLSSIEHTGLCIFLHNNGQIIIQDTSSPRQTILLTKFASKNLAAKNKNI